jgi:hypothetical protein
MFLNLLSFLVGLLCLGWVAKRFPEFLEPIQTRDLVPMMGLGFYVVVSFVSPMMVFTGVVFIVIFEWSMRKRNVNKMI